VVPLEVGGVPKPNQSEEAEFGPVPALPEADPWPWRAGSGT
jgi:hypothetical protein